MKKFIKQKLTEIIAIPSFKLPKNIELSDYTLTIVKNLAWSDIIVNNTGDDGVSTLYMNVIFKKSELNIISKSIVFTIQLLHNTYYQPHLFLSSKLQGIGLGSKILKAFIMQFGHIYAGKGRTVNPDANKMLYKLINDNDLDIMQDEKGLLILKKGNPDKDKLAKIILN